MTVLDWLLVLLLVSWAVFALRFGRKKPSGGGCGGRCAGCTGACGLPGRSGPEEGP